MKMLSDEQTVHRHKHVLVTNYRLLAGDPDGIEFGSLPLENIVCMLLEGRALAWLLFLALIAAAFCIGNCYGLFIGDVVPGDAQRRATTAGIIAVILFACWKFIRPRQLRIYSMSGHEMLAGAMGSAGLVELIEAIERARVERVRT